MQQHDFAEEAPRLDIEHDALLARFGKIQEPYPALLQKREGGGFGIVFPLVGLAYHLTLAFLGDIDDAEASRAMDALDAACAGSASVLLASDSLGKFGRPTDATLWLGIASDPALATLAERVREELAARDVPFDPKPFRPHITLGRRMRIPKKPLPLLAFPLPAQAQTVTLFKSTLSRDGAEYKPLYTVELARPNL